MRIMARSILGLTVLLFLLGASDTPDRQKLQGPWTVVDAMRGDELADDMVGHQIDFQGDSFTITSEGKMLFQGRFALDSDKSKKAIDFKHQSGRFKGKTWLGIYKVDGDTLKICNNSGSSSPDRPTGFEANPQSGHVVVLFKRVAP